VNQALEVVRPHRLRYGGDWPFALLAADSYTQIWVGIRDCLDGLDPEALWAVLGGTARRVYGLPASDEIVRERPQEGSQVQPCRAHPEGCSGRVRGAVYRLECDSHA
jgi:hypothetical protein